MIQIRGIRRVSSNAMVLLIMLSTFVAGLVLLENQYSKGKIVCFLS